MTASLNPAVLPQETTAPLKVKSSPSIDLTSNPSYKPRPFDGIAIKNSGQSLGVDYGKTFNYLYFGLEASSTAGSSLGSPTAFNNFKPKHSPKSLGFSVRAGAVFGSILTYFKVGVPRQRGDLSAPSIFQSLSLISKNSALKTRPLKSLSPGVGFETKFGEALSVGAEYSYTKRPNALNQLSSGQEGEPATSCQSRRSKNDFSLKLRYRF